MQKVKNSELNRLTVEEFKKESKTPLIVVLDNIRSLNNIGSVFRTADAFIIEAVYLCGITASPPHRDIHKTALGATESVDWLYFETTLQAVEQLRNNGYKTVAIEQAKERVMLDKYIFKPNDKLALIFGNEVRGVEQEIMNTVDECIEIPQLGTKHSLNISVSVGIVLWELFRQFNNH